MAKLVIFDWDGVVVNTVRMDYDIYKIITKELGKTMPDSIEKFGSITDGRWQTLYKSLGIVGEEETMKSVELYIKLRKVMEGDVKAYPGIAETFSKLKERGAKIAIISNNYEANIVRLMKRLVLDKYIDLIIPYHHERKMKPEPDQILKCMEKFSAGPEETVFVGDMEVDILAGKAAGVKTIAVTYGWHKRERLEKFGPDVVVDNPENIIENI